MSATPFDPAGIAQTLGTASREGRRWRCRCPVCGGHNLTIGLGDDGRILVKCWNGCAGAAVVERLKALNLWPGGGAPSPNGHRPASPVSPASPASPAEARAASPPGVASNADGARWWETYTGVSWAKWQAWGAKAIAGGVAFVWPSLPGVEKRRLAAGPKGLWTGSPCPPLWPELPAELPDEIWLAEGESDCGVLRQAGLPAFACTKGAAGGLPGEVLAELRRRGCRQVVVAFDHDAPGQEGGEKLAQAAAAAGLLVSVIEWDGLLRPDLGEKDVRDLSRRLGDPSLLRQAIEQAVRPWTSESTSESSESSESEEAEAAGPGPVPGPVPGPGAYPCPVMAEEAYYGLAGDVVRAVAPHTEADPVALLLSFLAAVSAALGPRPHVTVGETTHHLRVWPVLVGETAKARKGSSLAPVQRLLALADPAFAQDRIVSGLSSGEGLIWAVRDAITRWEKVKDPTTKVAELQEVTVDPGEPDKRLLVVEEEFAGVLKVLSRDGNTLSAVLRQAWERGDLRTLTKNSPARASGAHIVVLGHAVSEELARYLQETEIAGGLANRFLFACVRRSQCLPRGGRLPTLTALAARLRQVFEWVRGQASAFEGPLEGQAEGEEQGDVCGELRWSDAAGRLWDEVYPSLSEGKPGLVGALIARMEAQALRLAALYAVLDRSPEIQPEHLAAALAIVDYCEASARHIFGDRLGDPVADAIVEALRRAGPEGLSRWDLSNLLGRHVSSGRITHALAGLHAKGLARPERRETGGRPAEVWTWCGW